MGVPLKFFVVYGNCPSPFLRVPKVQSLSVGSPQVLQAGFSESHLGSISSKTWSLGQVKS